MIHRTFYQPIDSIAESRLVKAGIIRLLTDPTVLDGDEEGTDELFDASKPPTAIVLIDEVESQVVRRMYQALRVYELMLNDGTTHEVAYRGETDATCLTHGHRFCI